MRTTVTALGTLALALIIAGSSQTLTAQQASRLVIATGLDNPRGLAFGPDGRLYVAEAGTGGNETPCLPPLAVNASPRCYGPTGAITQVSGLGVHQRVITGLPSISPPGGNAAIGPHDIDFGFGAAWLTVGLTADPAERASFEVEGIQLGHLYRIDFTGQVTPILDLSIFEASVNPDGGALDSNPFGLLIRSSGGVFTDAGGNALINITPAGELSTLAVFPETTAPNPFGPGTVPMQAVPTTVIEAPGGGFFVGQLTGFPFPPGGANVYFVPEGGGTPVVVATGFTNIIDIALGADGNGYVLEHDADGLLGPGDAGRLIRVTLTGEQTEITSANLTNPGGITVGPDGALYITNNSSSAGIGEVIRIVP